MKWNLMGGMAPLPDFDAPVLIAYKWAEDRPATVSIAYRRENDWTPEEPYTWIHTGPDSYHVQGTVIAWMPLPEAP